MTDRRRLLVTAFSVPVLILLIGGLRPESTATGIPSAAFWVRKVSWGPDYDLVVAGDSRIYRGVSPRVLEEGLPGRRAVNFGFSSGAFDARYLAATRNLLAPNRRPRTIVLGVTPNSLTPRAARENGFVQYRAMDALGRAVRLHAGWLFRFLRMGLLDDLWNAATGAERGYFEVYHPDGWVAAHKVPEDPEEALEAYREAFIGNRSSPALIDGLIRRVRAWSREGIEVYGLRPPTTRAMLTLENALSGFDEAAFVGRFEAAGGRWLSFPPDAYPSYDGSHLREDGALALSRDLARALRRSERSERNHGRTLARQ